MTVIKGIVTEAGFFEPANRLSSLPARVQGFTGSRANLEWATTTSFQYLCARFSLSKSRRPIESRPQGGTYQKKSLPHAHINETPQRRRKFARHDQTPAVQKKSL